MNELIRELAEQTGGEFYDGFLGSPNVVKFTQDDLQKFAELIVQECLNKCIHVENECRENREHKAESSATLIKLLIKQHFGVE